jgi:hypothetical protein
MAKLAAFVPCRRAVAEQRAGKQQASPPHAADAGTSAAAGVGGALWTFAWPGAAAKASVASISAISAKRCWLT